MTYVIWSFEHDAWWGPDHCGYTTLLATAGRYTAEEAGKIVTNSVWCEEIAVVEQVAQDWGPPTHDPYREARGGEA